MTELRVLKRDIDALVTLVEHSALTVEQLARLQRMSGLQVTRRRVAQLEKDGYVQSRERQFRRRRGRAEKILSIAPSGVTLLRERGMLPDWVSDEQLPSPAAACEGHQLLLNWFRIHLQYLPAVIPSPRGALGPNRRRAFGSQKYQAIRAPVP